MKHISGKAMLKLLKDRGWVHVRTNGSHFVFEHPVSLERISVPVHGNQDMATGTQRRIMRQAGITDAEL